LTLQPDSKHSQQSDAGLFSQNAFFPAQNRRNAQRLFSWLGQTPKFTFGAKTLRNQCNFFNRILKPVNNYGYQCHRASKRFSSGSCSSMTWPRNRLAGATTDTASAQQRTRGASCRSSDSQ